MILKIAKSGVIMMLAPAMRLTGRPYSTLPPNQTPGAGSDDTNILRCALARGDVQFRQGEPSASNTQPDFSYKILQRNYEFDRIGLMEAVQGSLYQARLEGPISEKSRDAVSVNLGRRFLVGYLEFYGGVLYEAR